MESKKEKIPFFLSDFLQADEKLQETKENPIAPEVSALEFFAAREKKEEEDFERIRLLYPKSAQALLSLIEDICDRMEYKGSMMYDEYPDKISIQKICSLSCKENENFNLASKEDFFQILLLQEICHRRCRYRRRCELFHQA